MHPDPAGLAAVDISNPQSWNRYAYVLNNPGNWTDPTGMWCSADVGQHDTPCNASNFPGDDSCTINGISANCGLAAGLISDGTGVQCPNNTCSGIIYAEQRPGGGWRTPSELPKLNE